MKGSMNKTTYTLSNVSGTLYVFMYEPCGSMLRDELGRKGEVTPRMLRESTGLSKSETRELIRRGTLTTYECGTCQADLLVTTCTCGCPLDSRYDA